jgi:putative heme transporter
MDVPESTTKPKAKRAPRILQALLSLAVVVAIFGFAFPKLADYSQVWDEITQMTPLELVTLAIAAIWNITTYWFVMIAALPGSNLWQSMKINQTSTAVANTMPGGGAIGIGVTYGMYTGYGFSKSDIALSILVSGIWNNFVKLGMPVLALALLAIQGDAGAASVTASLAGVAALTAAIFVFALALRSDRFARRIGQWLGSLLSFFRKLVRKPPVTGMGESVAAFRRDAVGLIRGRWVWLTAASLLSHLSLYLVLLLSLRYVGVSETEVTWTEALAAFAFVRLISALPITPGGLGVVELGLTAALISAGGDEAEVAAAVLLYRALTYLLPIPIGVAMYLKWRKGSEARRERVARQQAAAQVSPEHEVVVSDEPVARGR